MLTKDELRSALETKRTVLWRGRADYESAIGSVTAIITRHENEADVVSAEVTNYGARRSVMICRPEDLEFWNAVTSVSVKGDTYEKHI